MGYEHLYINELTIPESKDIGYIYKITSPTGRIYVGQTTNISKRCYMYNTNKCKDQPLLYKSLIKYGFSNHNFSILDEVSIKMLNDTEKFYISICKSFHGEHENGMNLTIGGDGTRGYKHNEECKERIRQIVKEAYRNGFVVANKGVPMTEEQKKRQSETLKRKYASGEIINGNKGKKLSPERIEQIKKRNKGQIATEEQRRKISEGLKGKTHSPERVLKVRIANTGKKRTKEQCDRMSLAHTGKKLSYEHIQKIIIRNTGRKCSDETKEKISQSNRDFFKTDDGYKLRSDLSKRMWEKPEYRDKKIKQLKGHKVLGETKIKISEARKKQIFTKESQEKKSCTLKKLWADPVFRAKVLLAIKNSKLKKLQQCLETT